MGYEFSIDYKKGKENKVFDALFKEQEGEVGALAVISFPTPTWIEELRHSYSFLPRI